MKLRFWLLAWVLGMVVAFGPPRARPLPVYAGDAVPEPNALQVRVLRVDDGAFPVVEVRVWVWDNQNRQVPDLRVQDFTLQEDGRPVRIERLAWIAPRLQWVIALNPDRGFALRDNQGVSRYTYIFYQLKNWLDILPAGEHTLSLLLRDQVLVEATQDPQAVVQALQAYQPTRKEPGPSATALATALDLAARPPAVPETLQGVLFITAALDRQALQTLPELARQAQERHVQVMVWVVGNRQRTQAQQAAWAELAQATGGHVALFSGVEVLPDLKEVFARRDRVYTLRYRSSRTQGGPVALTLQVQPQDLPAGQARFSFSLNLEPPRPIPTGVPERLTLVQDPATPPATPRVRPSQLRVPLTVDFPDGRIRDLEEVRLLVDGQVVDRRAGPNAPDFLIWPLAGVTPGAHTLVVEAVDVWGLVGRSPELTVQVEPPVTPAAPGVFTRTQGRMPPPAESRGLWVLPALLGGLLVLLLAWGTWMEYRYRGVRRWLRASRRSAVEAKGEAGGVWLAPLGNGGPALHIPAGEVVVGSSEEGAQVVLKDPSVASRHARFWQDAQGRVYVADLGSLAGTWVNFAPVSESGHLLEEGDILHIGRVGFRVHYRPPTAGAAKPIAARAKQAEVV